ncbi:MAG: insulinase family protein [Gammaproteobacteria bacterium]|jgi:secreted Zn-dependent insulinase-like peptidase|nr:insulinase family protein [Gammaproteobacteria bacterium]
MNIAPTRTRILIAMMSLTLLFDTAAAGAADLVRSPEDRRAYESLVLENGLRVLLVSDPETDMAATALNVDVGHYDDPAERQGLAHFLEHMLFLGTEKYPRADDYREYITRHGGHANAVTGPEHTVYFFDVSSDYLDGALDRFAQFFVAPLFGAEYVQREMQAVESEYRLRLRDDGRRLNDAIKETINPAHPYSKFSTGNLQTLGDREDESARDAVIDFYRKHYSANLMTLVVIGAEPLPRLKAMVEERMSAIPDTGRKARRIEASLRAPAQGPERLDVVPFKEQRLLRLEFVFPWEASYTLSKPTTYLAHLLGHEGAGSLHALLIERGWITNLSAGGSRMTDSEGVFSVSLELTPSGVAAAEEIAELVFRHITLIAGNGIRADIHAELVRMSELNFAYREPAQPRSESVTLATNLQIYPPELALAGPYLLAPFDPQAIRAVLSHLRPDNLRMTLVAPGLETTRRSRWYDTPYELRPLPPGQLARWARAEPHPALALPAPNVFLPQRAALKDIEEKRSEHPQLLAAEAGLRVWQMQDTEFRVPRADLFVSVEAAAAASSARSAVLASLYLSLAREALTPHAYPAELAGLRYDVYRTSRGFGFSISGYDEKQPLLASLIVDHLLKPRFTAESFTLRHAELVRQLENSKLNAPYQQLSTELDYLLYRQRWTSDELLAATAGITLDDLRRFVPELLAELRLEIFSHGNITAADALGAGRAIAGRFFASARPGPAVPRDVSRLEPGRQHLRSIDTRHDDTAILVYYQAADAELATAARVLMLEQLVKAPFFDTLRTREQLGYVVQAHSTSALRLPGLNFLIQSPAQGPEVLRDRIDAFMSSHRERIATMDAEAFERHRQGLLTTLRERDTSLSRRSLRLQAALSLNDYSFDRRERLAAEVERLRPEEVLAYYEEMLLSDRRARIVLQATGTAHQHQAIAAGEAWSAITELAAFRNAAAGHSLAESELPSIAAAVTQSIEEGIGAATDAAPPSSGTEGESAR